MRCSYCHQKGHSKRQCPVLSVHFTAFLTSTKAIRGDYQKLLSDKGIGKGSHFKVVDYGHVIVRVVGIGSVNLFSTWAGGRTASSWGFLPLETMKRIVVEQYPQGLDGAGTPWVRRFSVHEILERHEELTLCSEPILNDTEAETWLSCADFKNANDMIAVKGKAKASVFASKSHPYISN